MKKCATALLVGVLLLIAAAPAAAGVWEVRFQGEVTTSQARWLAGIYDEAAREEASGILLVLDTPGGRIDSAVEIAKTIGRLRTTVLVEGGAISAGALLALSADEMYMLEGSTIGAAEPRLGLEPADEKTVSYWSAQLAGAAEKNGRDKQIARAMADESIEIDGLVGAGKLLTMTAREALTTGMTDGVYESREVFLVDREIRVEVTVEKGAAERLADLLTSSAVSTILLMLGLAGIFIELFTPGFGVPGGIGIVSLGLYFGGSMLAGLSGWETVLLFFLGIILLCVEVFVLPGFGVAGIAGIAALFGGIFLAAPGPAEAVRSIVISLLGAIAILALLLRVIPSRRRLSRIILRKEEDAESGYVAVNRELADLAGRTGRTLTPLRPAGTARIDGRNVDVVTEGGFIGENTEIQVRSVIGARVIVGKKEED